MSNEFQLFKHWTAKAAFWAVLAAMATLPAAAGQFKVLHGHVPEVARALSPIGSVPATNELHLAIGVPLRDSAGLDQFLADVYDPASPLYHHYLTPAEFADRFSATEADYEAVKNFAATNGFKITGTHGNRLVLDVSARASDIERAFHLHLVKFQHPTENRQFFAPDTEPTVDSSLAIVDVQGLSDYWRARPRSHPVSARNVTAKSGSAPDGSGAYFGNDFRNAYLPGTTLTGAGQTVGLFQLDGYYASDIATYAQEAGGGRTSIQVQAVMIGSTNWSIGVNGGNIEVSLDIEMSMSMAPGLSKIMVFEAGSVSYVNTILSSMAASNSVKCFSSSWGWSGGPSTTTDNIFKNMAAQGQSFFNASGDSDAFTVGANSANGVDNTSSPNAPSSCPYITQVGATTLTTGGGASYSSETAWNWGYDQGSYVGTSGGVSSYYSIPSWQTNLSMASNLGSTSQRNIPDVALTGDNVYVISGGNASGGEVGGTSCAAPLWAGFMALVNQQATALGASAPGFINPAIYAIGKGLNPQFSYATCFHDVTAGNNEWPSSPSQYPAVAGYDLCTGWGTPSANLINALAVVPDALAISPGTGFAATGVAGGPFNGGSVAFTLTNAGSGSFTWSLINTSSWLSFTASSGVLPAAQQTTVNAGLASAAVSLPPGSYSATVIFSNQSSQVIQSRQFALQILAPLTVSPATGFTCSGPVGGNFNITAQSYVLTNLGAATTAWGLVNTSAWLAVSQSRGALAGGAQTTFTVGLAPAAYALPGGVYSASVLLTNAGVVVADFSFVAQIGQSILQNGGFETGNFSGWTLNGSTTVNGTPYNAVETAGFKTSAGVSYVHSGSYGAVLGQSQSVATLSQTVPTVPGQAYLVSLWVNNPHQGSTQSFSVNWQTNSGSARWLYGITNPPVFVWTNLIFAVTASSSSSTLEIEARNDPDYFGLDDVSVTPIPIPTFTMLGKGSGNLSLGWNSLAGVAYDIQYKTNLAQAAWIDLVTNTAAGVTTGFTNTLGSPARFYRVRQLP
jgi:subtilase family serine protease